MDVNLNFAAMLKMLNDVQARYLVVGAYAVIYHTEPRYTKDLDIWVDCTSENAARVWKALGKFGAPLGEIELETFKTPEMVYQIGLAPNRIDLIMSLPPLQFEDAWSRRIRTTFGGVPVPVLSIEDLIIAKKAAARPQDLLDIRKIVQHRLWKQKKKKSKKKR